MGKFLLDDSKYGIVLDPNSGDCKRFRPQLSLSAFWRETRISPSFLGVFQFVSAACPSEEKASARPLTLLYSAR
jgi:hypothetical protein